MIIVFQDIYCDNCGDEYIDICNEWCKSCQINYFKKMFTNWASGNEEIDNLIQEKRLEINKPQNTVFEWILYNQFDSIKEISKGGFAIIYSAIWKDGPLCYNYC